AQRIYDTSTKPPRCAARGAWLGALGAWPCVLVVMRLGSVTPELGSKIQLSIPNRTNG
ncbi:MAG: hypothetical protein HOK27_03655, partial [Rhodobacteraceae bacterium]|nr:hypothetical protein [Paracoccaceae bacterium]